MPHSPEQTRPLSLRVQVALVIGVLSFLPLGRVYRKLGGGDRVAAVGKAPSLGLLRLNG
ncbi:hypothetical protein BH24DEI2_BH24DEI2_09460 [soil metagenome]